MLKRLPIILVAGVVSAAVATAISALVLTLYFVLASHSPIGLEGGTRFVVLSARLCAATAPYALSFGLFGGCLLGAWLTLRAPSYRSTAHLLGECAGLGILLSLTFPVFHGQVNHLALAMWRTGLIPNGVFRYIVAWPAFLNAAASLYSLLRLAYPALCWLALFLVLVCVGK